MIVLATTPAPGMVSYPVYLAGRGNTVKNVRTFYYCIYHNFCFPHMLLLGVFWFKFCCMCLLCCHHANVLIFTTCVGSL